MNNLFVKQVVAQLKGDDVTAKAIKIARKGIAAINGQISSLESKKVDLETAKEEADESRTSAMFPTEIINSNENYINQIVRAEERYQNTIDDLEEVENTLVYFKALKERVEKVESSEKSTPEEN